MNRQKFLKRLNMDLAMTSYHAPGHVKFKEGSNSLMRNVEEMNDATDNWNMTDFDGNSDQNNFEGEMKSNTQEEFMDGLDWKDGIGTLPGSDMKFRMNEFGVIELITDDALAAKEPENMENDDGVSSDGDLDESVVEVKEPEIIEVKKYSQSHGNDLKTGLKGELNGSVGNMKMYAEPSPNGAQQSSVENGLMDTPGTSNGMSTETLLSEGGFSICPMCGRRDRQRNFFGRFCSRTCNARNASRYRKIYLGGKKPHPRESAQRQSTELVHDVKTNVTANESSVIRGTSRRSDDLKIRIRLSSSSPPVDINGARMEIAKKDNPTKSAHNILSGTPFTNRNRKKRFVWSQYLAEEKAVAVPDVAFAEITGKDPFPGENLFKPGMALEGVDPKHQSLICPLNVTAVSGHRIRLHFCGYSESYDFWVNADCPLIFPCGFCEKTERKLEPPKGMSSSSFQWKTYMKKNRLHAAAREFFSNLTEVRGNNFSIGQKLEAVDKHNPELTCVATVNDVIGDYVLIHFDGWTKDFDYWCFTSSYLIHPVGWCEKEGKELTPPEGFKEINFSWKKYLEETNSEPVPEAAFKPLTKHQFEAGMKLEVVDARNPVLIRVATIADIIGSRILIHFDGWSDVYDFWTDVESTDIHPVGWCSKTDHKLQPPIYPEDIADTSGQGGCPISGCIGVGHIKGAKFSGHHSEYGCPYSPQNLNRECVNDRLAKPRLSSSMQSDNFERMQESIDYEETSPPAKIRRTSSRKSHSPSSDLHSLDQNMVSNDPPAEKTIISSSEMNSLVDENGKSQYSSLHHSVYLSALSSFPNYDLTICWEQHAKLLPCVKGISVKDVSDWSSADVAKFVTGLTGHSDIGEIFVREEIDGEAALLLTQLDILKVLKIKLGPAVKIYNAILLIKASDHLPS